MAPNRCYLVDGIEETSVEIEKNGAAFGFSKKLANESSVCIKDWNMNRLYDFPSVTGSSASGIEQ